MKQKTVSMPNPRARYFFQTYGSAGRSKKYVSLARSRILVVFTVLLCLILLHQAGYGQTIGIARANLEPRESGLKSLAMASAKRSWEDYLVEGNYQEYSFRLPDDGIYALAGAGDYNVKNLDIKLYGDNIPIRKDQLEYNMPLVIFRGNRGTEFSFRVIMVKGSGYYCVSLFKTRELTEKNQTRLLYVNNERDFEDDFDLTPISEGSKKGWLKQGEYRSYEFDLDTGRQYAIIASTASPRANSIDIDVYGPDEMRLKPVFHSPRAIFVPKNNGLHTVHVSPSRANVNSDVSFRLGVYEVLDRTNDDVVATITDIDTKHDVYQGGRKGMQILVDFDVYNHKGATLRAAAYFRWRDSRNPLKDENGQFRTVSGHVATGEPLLPAYRRDRFEDVALFIPYDELHIDQYGEHYLDYVVKIYSMKKTDFIEHTGATNGYLKGQQFVFSRDPSRNLFSSRDGLHSTEGKLQFEQFSSKYEQPEPSQRRY